MEAMMRIDRRVVWGVIAGLFVLAGSVVIVHADVTKTVNCGAGETITAALETQGPGQALVLIVNGTCKENVTITRNDVTLQGGPNGASVLATDPKRGAIVVDGAQRVSLQGLTIRQRTLGVAGIGGASFEMLGNRIRSTDEHAILVDGHSRAVIRGNVVEAKVAPAIHVSSSTATLAQNTVRGSSGVLVTGDGRAEMGQGYMITSAGAIECAFLQKQLAAQLKLRTDSAATHAKAIAEQAQSFHERGEHTKSVAKYEEAATAAGIMLEHLAE
jgi:parallel beta helix pectate lyase-like protein